MLPDDYDECMWNVLTLHRRKMLHCKAPVFCEKLNIGQPLLKQTKNIMRLRFLAQKIEKLVITPDDPFDEKVQLLLIKYLKEFSLLVVVLFYQCQVIKIGQNKLFNCRVLQNARCDKI